jgi:hypothetical protein
MTIVTITIINHLYIIYYINFFILIALKITCYSNIIMLCIWWCTMYKSEIKDLFCYERVFFYCSHNNWWIISQQQSKLTDTTQSGDDQRTQPRAQLNHTSQKAPNQKRERPQGRRKEEKGRAHNCYNKHLYMYKRNYRNG